MDSTARYLASVYDKLPPDDGRLLLQFAEFLIEKQPRVISAREARRQVSAWLVREVGNLLMGGQPEFMPGDQPVWRVPVIVAGSPDQLTDSINVDARSGELLIDESTPGQILSHVQFAVSHTAPNLGFCGRLSPGMPANGVGVFRGESLTTGRMRRPMPCWL